MQIRPCMHALLYVQVPHQYPSETRDVLLRSRNTSLLYDYSQPDYEELKKRRQRYYTSF